MSDERDAGVMKCADCGEQVVVGPVDSGPYPPDSPRDGKYTEFVIGVGCGCHSVRSAGLEDGRIVFEDGQLPGSWQ